MLLKAWKEGVSVGMMYVSQGDGYFGHSESLGISERTFGEDATALPPGP